MTLRGFGAGVMQWGTGDEAAMARIDTISREWLVANGVTLAMVEAWAQMYEEVHRRDPRNPSAVGRIELMRHCMGLLEGSG